MEGGSEMKLSKCKMYGRLLTDFLLPDQIEILERQVDEEIKQAAEAAWEASKARCAEKENNVFIWPAKLAFEKWFEQFKEAAE